MSTAEGSRRAIRRELASPVRSARHPVRHPDAPTIIELQDVWLSFTKPVLRGVDLTVGEGETLVVFGESGSGKSTILKLIMRLLVPDSGRVCVFGENVVPLSYAESQAFRRRFGMVFQYAALFDSLTIYENVAYPLRENDGRSERRLEEIVREKLEFVNLDPDTVMPQLPGELSGGMRKRVGIARAIATEPEILLYDEPTAGLDPLAVETIVRLNRKLQNELGVTQVVVTHDIKAGFRVADRVNLLRDGRIVFDGTPEDMVASDDPYIQSFLG